jgi:hypothetical protein
MRNLITACCIAILGSFAVVEAQGIKPRGFDPAMNKLLTVKWISNHDPGFGGSNEFYKLSKELLKSHGPSDFRRMVNQRNPIVRAMGLLCLAQTDRDQYFLLLLSHWTDPEQVSLQQGCIGSKITVGEFVQRLFVNPYFLDPGE